MLPYSHRILRLHILCFGSSLGLGLLSAQIPASAASHLTASPPPTDSPASAQTGDESDVTPATTNAATQADEKAGTHRMEAAPNEQTTDTAEEPTEDADLRALDLSQLNNEQIAMLRRRAEAGSALADCLLGDLSYMQASGESIPDEAVQHYRRAAERGLTEAMVKLAICCEALDTDAGDAEAVGLLRRAADRRDARALYLLACCYLEGIGVPASNVLYYAYLQEAAAQGSLEACCSLGSCCEFGIGTPENKPAALAWYRKGAEGGDPEASYNLALCLENGIGTDADPSAAFSAMQSACEGGYTPAYAALALYYRHGIGTDADERKALDCINAGAEAGDPTALLYRGLCYAEGIGGISAEEAYRCFAAAAEQDYYEGYVFMSIMLRYGVGTEGSAARAQECYSRAVELASEEEAYALFSSEPGLLLDSACAAVGRDTMAEDNAPSASTPDTAAESTPDSAAADGPDSEGTASAASTGEAGSETTTAS